MTSLFWTGGCAKRGTSAIWHHEVPEKKQKRSLVNRPPQETGGGSSTILDFTAISGIFEHKDDFSWDFRRRAWTSCSPGNADGQLASRDSAPVLPARLKIQGTNNGSELVWRSPQVSHSPKGILCVCRQRCHTQLHYRWQPNPTDNLGEGQA
ncbi:hypothetical protein Q5P01_022586 [Channa striata]|uniref:Uncharacterized protein n=1 Tax=Channa striata TaxID=64152 RepID=A0AA88LR42_CHASR|nr:hypothetical protein Q5P01_022586 [Channa striata]